MEEVLVQMTFASLADISWKETRISNKALVRNSGHTDIGILLRCTYFDVGLSSGAGWG